MTDTLATVDLTNCDREPIHIPGSIQPHGILLAIDPGTGTILQVAGDHRRIAERETGSILNANLADVLGPDPASLARSVPAAAEPVYLGSLAAPIGTGGLDLTAHHRRGVLILELEPTSPRPQTAQEVLAIIRRAAAELEAAPALGQLLGAAARQARRLTGFDRVMIYRFLDDGSGSVVAEDKVGDLEPFLNHRYPASDIPKQARALYLQNLIRVIPDTRYVPAALTPTLNPLTRQPLDMSDCSLRSVSPIHVQYLKNMGVVASMSVSIVVDGALWGLVAFHHREPKLVPYELRELCKHLGQILSQQIKAREDAEAHQQILELSTARDEFVQLLANADSVEQPLREHISAVQNLVPSDGAALVFGDNITKTGHAPTEKQIQELARWLLDSAVPDPFETNSLVRHYAPAAAYANDASGLLATVVSREEPLIVLWFRVEHPERVNWAGNPHKPVSPGAEPGSLTPRKSFEVWKETIRNQSPRWSAAETDAARRFGGALFDLRQQHRLRELNLQLRRMLSDKEALLAQKDLLMQEINHRVQNSLQLVNSMLHLQARQAGDEHVKAHFEEASRRILAVSAVHQRLWRSDHIQSVDFGVYLKELRDSLVETWGDAWASEIKVHTRRVLIPTDKAVVLALIITELLTNAVKYAYGGQPGRIDVTIKESRTAIRVVVKDQGVGIGGEAPKSGLGSRLTRSLIAQLDGDLQIKADAPGTSITLTVPLAARTSPAPQG